MTTPSLCPSCRRPVPADAPGGICPSCALLGAAQPTVLMPSAQMPGVAEVAAAFPDLEVLDILGQGGMGIVFKARQPRLDRLVALKILPPLLAAQPGFTERFTREARALARLHHPHIVMVYDFGESGGFFYLLMEFVNGVNLRQAMRAGVKPEQAMLLVPRICEALQFAHDRGVLHRDIKPENILLDTVGVPKLADFGIARMAGDSGTAHALTLSGAALGTASYMAPEQIEKPATVDHRADIYSLGVVFYEMLTGELPLGRFAAPSEKAVVGEGVDQVVLRALEKERDRRHQSASEMKTRVEDLRGREQMPGQGGAEAGFSEWGSGGGPQVTARLLMILGGFSAAGIPLAFLLKNPHVTPIMMVWLTIALSITAGVVSSLTARPGPTAGRHRRPGPGQTGPRFESVSSRQLFGLPLYHIVRGYDPATGVIPVARGVFAAGPVAKGFFAFGGRAQGFVAFGGMAVGFVAFGGMALGVFSAGGFAGALMIALGGLAVASMPLGGGMAGMAPLIGPGQGVLSKHRMLYGPLPDPDGSLRSMLCTASGVAALIGGLAVMVVIQMMFFAGSPRQAPVPAAPVSRAINPWPARIFWLLVLLLAAPLLAAIALLIPAMQKTRTATEPRKVVSQDLRYLTAPAVGSVDSSSRAPFSVPWSKGSAELVGIARYPLMDRSDAWWQMNGSRATEGPYVPGPAAPLASEMPPFGFVFHLKDLPEGASAPVWLCDYGGRVLRSGPVARPATPGERLPGHILLAASFPGEVERTNIKMGVAWRPWQVVHRRVPPLEGRLAVEEHGERWLLSGSVSQPAPGKPLAVTITSGLLHDGWETRIMVLGKTGVIFPESRTNHGDREDWTFSIPAAEEPVEYRFEVRPYEWVEFRNVVLPAAGR